MATGNVKGNLISLQTELRHVKYPHSPDYASLSQGSPTQFLPIMHYMMCDYSRPLTQLILECKIELGGKTDGKFMEGVYKVFRDIFTYIPRITNSQFFSKGFAEHKILMTRDMVSMVRKKHREMTRGKTSTVRPNSGQGAAGNKKLPDVVFKPSLSSTIVAGSSGPLSPISPAMGSDDEHRVSIVVGMTPVPTQLADVRPTVENLEDAITPRRTRRGVRGQDTGYNTAEGSPDHEPRPVIYDSNDLKTHPFIRDLAITVADLLNRVRTLEEQQENAEHQNNAKMILLESKVKLLEAQMRLSYRHSSSSEGEERGWPLDTVFEESSITKT